MKKSFVALEAQLAGQLGQRVVVSACRARAAGGAVCACGMCVRRDGDGAQGQHVGGGAGGGGVRRAGRRRGGRAAAGARPDAAAQRAPAAAAC